LASGENAINCRVFIISRRALNWLETNSGVEQFKSKQLNQCLKYVKECNTITITGNDHLPLIADRLNFNFEQADIKSYLHNGADHFEGFS
jgi:predicted Zn-dependent protease